MIDRVMQDTKGTKGTRDFGSKVFLGGLVIFIHENHLPRRRIKIMHQWNVVRNPCMTVTVCLLHLHYIVT